MPVPILLIVTTDDSVLDKSTAGANAAGENLVQNTSETKITYAPSSSEIDNFFGYPEVDFPTHDDPGENFIVARG
jgi:hypothetical protein